ncbi:MAG: hypothetical protein CML20_05035 [Rheinheimera sp.]|nr:hypothetical protein [Rheinheimera sp.]
MNYDDTLIEEFERFDFSNFQVLYHPPRVFVCGGEYNTGKLVPASMRDRIIQYFELNDDDDEYRLLSKSCVMAEDFKDYFKDGAYSDLMVFEDDIAKVSTLIIICLESPGSLVELGLLCNNSYLSKRLLVIAPQSDVEAKDSFIYLGPLSSLVETDPSSVLIYPWPNNELQEYEHIDLIAGDIKNKLRNTNKTSKFDIKNSAHIAFLIHDIIQISSPIKITEIELALASINVHINEKFIHRLLFLLEKINLIKFTTYSNVNYYYACNDEDRRIKFGRAKDNSKRDEGSIKMSIRRSFILDENESSKKRRLALKQISNIKRALGGAQ